MLDCGSGDISLRITGTAWWPWVENYKGKLRAGAVRPGPIYARIWIDHEEEDGLLRATGLVGRRVCAGGLLSR